MALDHEHVYASTLGAAGDVKPAGGIMRLPNAARIALHLTQKLLLTGPAVLVTLSLTGTAYAETIRIVAIGASNTSGYAVGAGNAWPALLERMLRSKGYDVTVQNAGVTGETSSATLARVDSVIGPGTKIVIYDLGGGNDRDSGQGGQTAANSALIAQRIRAHGAIAINTSKQSVVGSEKSNPSAWIAGDPHHHITAQSQQRLAASLVPKVIAALGNKKR